MENRITKKQKTKKMGQFTRQERKDVDHEISSFESPSPIKQNLYQKENEQKPNQ